MPTRKLLLSSALFVSVVALLSACTTTNNSSSPYGGWFNLTKYSQPHTYPTSLTERTFNASYDKVWDALIDAFAEIGVPPDTANKSSGVLTFKFKDNNELDNFIDCGTDSKYGQLAKGYTPITHKSGGYSREMALGMTANIRIKKLNKNKTSVKIFTNYQLAVVTMSGAGRIWFKDLRSFGAGEPARYTSYQFLNNSYEKNILCVPTFNMESTMLKQVQKLLQ